MARQVPSLTQAGNETSEEYETHFARLLFINSHTCTVLYRWMLNESHKITATGEMVGLGILSLIHAFYCISAVEASRGTVGQVGEVSGKRGRRAPRPRARIVSYRMPYLL